MKRTFKLVLAVVAVLILAMAGFAYYAIQSTPEPDEIIIDNVDLSAVADGTYTGEYDATMVKATVEVTVENNKIVSIVILQHQNGQGGEAESIIYSVMEDQSLDVDLVSGASLSSKVILKAIENALK